MAFASTNADPAELEQAGTRITQLERALNALDETAKSGDKLALDFPMDGSVDIIYNDKLVESIPARKWGQPLKIWLGYVPVADELKNRGCWQAPTTRRKRRSANRPSIRSLMDSRLNFSKQSVAIIGGGPASLMAAEIISRHGYRVDVYDAMPSVGRKFPAGGRGRHEHPLRTLPAFIRRYGDRASHIEPLLPHYLPMRYAVDSRPGHRDICWHIPAAFSDQK